MGNVPSTTQQAQAQLRSQTRYYVPKRHSIINATERAPPAGAREMAISATSHLVSPQQVEFSLIDGAVRNGYVDRLRIYFDALDYVHFGPKISRTLSLIERVQTLEIYCDMLPRVAILQFFSYPNVLESMPPQCPTLTTFYLATTFHQLVHFDVIAKVLLRCPNLACLKLEGPLLSKTSNSYEDYIPCKLDALILKYCSIKMPIMREILVRSGKSLSALHLEMVTGLDPVDLSVVIGTCLPCLKMLSIMTPDPSSTAVTTIELSGIMDYILAQPLPSLVYLYLSGLSITEEAMTRKANHIGIIVSPLPALQSLYLHYTIKFPMRALVVALMERKLPQIIRLEAIYSLSEVDVETYTALCQVCAERSIFMSETMTKLYAPLVSASAMSKDLAEDALEQEAEEIARNRARSGALAAARPSNVVTDTAPAEEEVSGRHEKRKNKNKNKERHHHSRRHRRHRSRSSKDYDKDMRVVESESEESEDVTDSETDSADEERRRKRDKGKRKERHRSSKAESSRHSSRY